MFSLGQRIRDLRVKKGITQIELAGGMCTPSMISQIESDRAKPSYKILTRIADRLEISIEKLLSDVNLDLEFTSKFKMGMGLVQAKEFRTAIPFLQELLDSPHHRIKNSEILLELATCFLELGDVEEAISQLNGVYEVANMRHDHEMLATTFMRLGSAYQKQGELALSLFHSKRAMEELEKVKAPDPSLRSKVLTRLGRIHEAMGKAADAARYYEDALLLTQGNIEERGSAYLRVAEMHYRAQSFEKAEEYASKAFTILEQLSNVEHEKDLKYQLIKLKSNRGNRKQSIDALMQIAEQFEADSKKEKAGAVYADIAMLCSEHGEYEEAWAYAERARLTLSDLHPAMGIVHRVLASVYLDRCDDEKAEKHLCNAINIFEQHGKVSELEETQLLMCQHLINQGRHSEAFRQMEAFHIFIKRKLEQRGIVL